MQRLQGVKRLGLTGLTAAALDLSTDYLTLEVDGAGIRIGWQRLTTDTQNLASAAAEATPATVEEQIAGWDAAPIPASSSCGTRNG